MPRHKFSPSFTRMIIVLAVVAVLAGPASAVTPQVIYSFTDGADGAYPDSDLIMDSAGNIYGSAVQGGAYDSGAVFQLTPASSGWTQTILYSFRGSTDGGEPYNGVTLDAKGNLYGTAVAGGTGTACDAGCGVVYKLSHAGGVWKQRVIYNFTGGNDGCGPGAGVTIGPGGVIYGMAPCGGAYGLGVIYQLKPNPDGTWTQSVIHAFTGGDDGSIGSPGRLIFDAAGNLYGVATVGGAAGHGVAFQLSNQAGNWTLTPLYAFQGSPDGDFPYGGLVFDKAGNLYGTTFYGGASGVGSVYKLSYSNGAWHETVLYNFSGAPDGASPIGNLIFVRGILYGTTSDGGVGYGTIFKLAPDGSKQRVVHIFRSNPDAAVPYNGLIFDAAGNLYGPSVAGGAFNEGAIYKFTP